MRPPVSIRLTARMDLLWIFFFFQAEDGIRDLTVTGVQTCALPISSGTRRREPANCVIRQVADVEIDAVTPNSGRLTESGGNAARIVGTGLACCSRNCSCFAIGDPYAPDIVHTVIRDIEKCLIAPDAP